MQYTIVYNSLYEYLIKEVNRLIGEGWQPLGGVAVTGDGIENYFYQAMIKNTL